MPQQLCQTCGAPYTEADTEESYYFSSLTYPKRPWPSQGDAEGFYVSAADIIALGEPILTCPKDGTLDRAKLGYAADTFTPAGASMATGDDRYTSGDPSSSEPGAGEETPQVPPLSTPRRGPTP